MKPIEPAPSGAPDNGPHAEPSLPDLSRLFEPPTPGGSDPFAGQPEDPDPALEPEVGGRYQILEPIGEGGFGTVYRARQQYPVRREVALKLVKLGMDTRAVIARFEAERQALANAASRIGCARTLNRDSTFARLR
jgi:serine/threonine protein kinase